MKIIGDKLKEYPKIWYGLDKEIQMDGGTNAWQPDTEQSVWLLK